MKKLSTANPTLSYPERQALLADFVPAELIADTEIAAFIEKSGDHIESYVQSVRDAHVSDNILSWA
jgi:acetyl-CoA carboxylase/biotin carboxylase 1